MRRWLPAVLLVVAGAAGCGGPADAPETAPDPAPDPAPDARVVGVLDGTELRLEVADTLQERATGLMGRASVPAGTGMVFRFDQPSEGRFYMFQVPIPLRATFIREGRVVSTVVMPPCPLDDPQACPTYGADGPFDTVVETDPEHQPRPEPGDRFSLRS